MAKRKRKSGGARTRTRTRTVTKYRTRRAPAVRRRSSPRRSSGGGWLPPKDDMMDMAGAAFYGYAEGAMVKSDGVSGDHWLAKVPRPIDALGFTGNIAVMAWIAAKITKNQYLRHFAKGTLDVAAYKIAKNGELFKTAAEIGGEDDGGYYDVEGLAAEIGEDDQVDAF